VTEIPSSPSPSFNFFKFISSLFFDIPHEPCILSFKDNGTDVFVPLPFDALSVISLLYKSEEFRVHFKGDGEYGNSSAFALYPSQPATSVGAYRKKHPGDI